MTRSGATFQTVKLLDRILGRTCHCGCGLRRNEPFDSSLGNSLAQARVDELMRLLAVSSLSGKEIKEILNEIHSLCAEHSFRQVEQMRVHWQNTHGIAV